MPVFQTAFSLDALEVDNTRFTVSQTGYLQQRRRWVGPFVRRLLLRPFPLEQTILKIGEVMEQEAASAPSGKDGAA